MAKKTKEDYTHTLLHDLSGPRYLDNILSAHAYLVDGSHVDDDVADRVAGVKDYVQDAGDMHGVSHTDHLTFNRELFGMIREIEAQGYIARWGRYATDDQFNVGVLTFFKTADLQTSERALPACHRAPVAGAQP